MNIGWPRTFGLDLDLIRRALPFYARQPKAGRAEAEAQLGIGGQKVQGLNSWLKYLSLRDSVDGTLTPLGQLILDWDPDLEDRGTLCTLHYVLVSNHEATVWFESINHFLRGRDSFTADDLKTFFEGPDFAGTSLKQMKSDRGLFLSTYAGQDRRALQNLGLLQKTDGGYAIRPVRDVPPLALGYCLYDRRSQYHEETTTDIRRLLHEDGSPGTIFRMPDEVLRRGLAEIESTGLLSVTRIADIDGVAYTGNVAALDLLKRHYQFR